MITESIWARFPYLSVLLGRLDHVHVHVVDQVGHLWHVLDDLVGLSGSISLQGEQRQSLF